MAIIPRDYQLELIEKIQAHKAKRNCVQSPTGSGKTAIFTFLAENFEGNVLILVNKTELLEQTAELLEDEPAYIVAGLKEIPKGKITIAMVESFWNKQKDGKVDINDYDLVIADEVQNTQFVKTFENYKGRLLGFTATPVIDKREFFFKCKYCGSKQHKRGNCCGKEMVEYSKSITLKKWYGELITGTPISKLIELGRLVDVHNYVCNAEGLEKLKTDKSGMFTNEDEVFENNSSNKNLVANYQEHCQGLKTMVFNSTIKANKRAFETFQALGYNVRYYDSESDENRTEVVEWFRNTPDAVLMSVGVFTTGFDVDDVQAIICNRAISSLSLYHQIVGRGGRPTKKIFKPFFKFIDLGGNVARHGSWADDVDWNALYNDEQERKKKVCDLESFVICHGCEAMIEHYDCEYCGASEPEHVPKEIEKVTIAQEVGRLPRPRASHILNYAEANKLDVNSAKVLTANYILDMFIFSRTSKEVMEQKWEGYLKPEIIKMIHPIYHALHRSSLEGNRRRTFNDFFNKVETKIKKHYKNG